MLIVHALLGMDATWSDPLNTITIWPAIMFQHAYPPQ